MRLDSGVCNSVAVLANTLHDKGNSVYFATVQGIGPLVDMLSVPNSNVIDLSQSRTTIGKIFRLRRFVLKNRIDVVHAHMYKPGLIGRLAAIHTGCKTIITEHSSHLPFKSWLRGFWENAIDSYLARHTDSLIAVSNSAAVAFASRTYLPPNLIKVIPNAVDLKKFKNRNNFKEENKAKIILFMGRLAYEKNLDLLIRIFASVHSTDPKVKLVVAGSGYLEGEFKLKIKELGVESSVELLGAVKDIQNLMQEADMLLLTSHWEGLPMSILEAHACGLPVVATSVPGVSDVLVNGVNGFLFESSDLDSATEKVRNVLAGGKEVGIVIKNALTQIVSFSPDVIAGKYISEYANR